MTSWGWAGPSLFGLVEIGLRRVEISWSKCFSVFLKQRSASVLKKSHSRKFLPSLGKSQSRKTLNWSLGKVSVSIDLNMFSLKKSQCRRNRKSKSRKSISLDNFHWQSPRLLSSDSGFRIRFVAAKFKFKSWLVIYVRFVPLNHNTIPYSCNLIHSIHK